MRLEEKAVAADRKRWQEMKAAGTLEQWCREYDLRHAEVEKELVKRKTALQEGKAVINMGLKLKNAVRFTRSYKAYEDGLYADFAIILASDARIVAV